MLLHQHLTLYTRPKGRIRYAGTGTISLAQIPFVKKIIYVTCVMVPTISSLTVKILDDWITLIKKKSWMSVMFKWRVNQVTSGDRANDKESRDEVGAHDQTDKELHKRKKMLINRILFMSNPVSE